MNSVGKGGKKDFFSGSIYMNEPLSRNGMRPVAHLGYFSNAQGHRYDTDEINTFLEYDS